MARKDFYELLGVARDEQKTIKRAFLKKLTEEATLIEHGDPHAEEKFKEVNEAYSALRRAKKLSQL